MARMTEPSVSIIAIAGSGDLFSRSADFLFRVLVSSQPAAAPDQSPVHIVAGATREQAYEPQTLNNRSALP